MTTPHILNDTTPVLDGPDGLVRSTITDAWGLFFAQGGVVMAAALRGMEAVLDRPDLSLASASATYCRPVACGPVVTHVDVLRSGRRGAQVHGRLRDQTAGEDEVSVDVTAVFTDPMLAGPTLSPLQPPPELVEPPAPGSPEEQFDSEYPLGFLDNTEWRTATTPAALTGPIPAEAVPRLAVWFRFREDPAPDGASWDPALLPIPGDSLGTALVAALGDGEEPVGSVSLQIGLHVFAPMTGSWIGVDSTCTHVGNGLASGVLNLWSGDGRHVATVTQTAMLRSFG